MGFIRNLGLTVASLTLIFCLSQAEYIWYLAHFEPEDDVLEKFIAIRSYGEENMKIVEDPAGGPDWVLRTFYPKGSHSPAYDPRGGAQFYSYPIHQRKSVTLSYEVYFAENFDFVKGGKLPGLMGGETRTCSGGRDSEWCFSARLMFRRDGDGETYFYSYGNQTEGFCEQEYTKCNFEKGHSIGRGTFRFKVGEWQSVSQQVILNTPGKTDGLLRMWYNGNLVHEQTHLNFRVHEEVEVTGIFFSTFFGGSDDTWATPVDTNSYFRKFYLWHDDQEQPLG